MLIHGGEAEMQIEFSRQALCKLEAFEPYAAFQRIDRNGKGYIAGKDLLAYSRDNDLDGIK